jgi:hypothetical protein
MRPWPWPRRAPGPCSGSEADDDDEGQHPVGVVLTLPDVRAGPSERFEEYGVEQWFGVWSSVTPSG